MKKVFKCVVWTDKKQVKRLVNDIQEGKDLIVEWEVNRDKKGNFMEIMEVCEKRNEIRGKFFIVFVIERKIQFMSGVSNFQFRFYCRVICGYGWIYL